MDKNEYTLNVRSFRQYIFLHISHRIIVLALKCLRDLDQQGSDPWTLTNITFSHLRNVESTSSMENMILIFDKPSRMGANNRCQVPIIEAKI